MIPIPTAHNHGLWEQYYSYGAYKLAGADVSIGPCEHRPLRGNIKFYEKCRWRCGAVCKRRLEGKPPYCKLC